MNEYTAMERYLGGFRGDTVEEVALSEYEGRVYAITVERRAQLQGWVPVDVYRIHSFHDNVFCIQGIEYGGLMYASPDELIELK